MVNKSMAEGYGICVPDGSALTPWARLGLSGLLVLLLFLLWYPALGGNFVFDDEVLIVRNPLVTGPLDLGGIFGGRFLGASVGQEAVPYWRPLSVLLFWGLWHLGAGAPWVFHAFALGLHLLSAVLGMRLFFRWGLVPWLAFLAALGFGAHPSQVEGVAWVSAGSWPLMALLLLGFLHAWDRFRRKGAPFWGMLGGVALGLALLAQEAAVLGFLLAGLLEFFAPGDSERRSGAWKRLACLGGVLLLWFLARSWVLGKVPTPEQGPGREVGEALVLRLHILGVHLRDLVLPRAPNVLRPLPLHLFGPGSGLGLSLAWAGGFLALLLGLLFWRRGRRLRLGRGLFWIACCLAPLLWIGEGTGVTPLADRYHAFAALGLVLFLADLRSLPWGGWLGPFLLSALALGSAWISRAALPPWKDARSFWEHACLQNKDSVLAAYSLGRQRLMDFERGGKPRDLEGAAEELDRALALRRSLGSSGKAEKVQELAIETARAWVQLTRAMRSKRVAPRGVREAFERILEKAPRSADAWVGLGVSLVLEQRVGDAEQAFRRAVDLDPAHPQARFNLARLLYSRGDRREAAEQLREVLRLQPGNRPARDLWRRLKGW